MPGLLRQGYSLDRGNSVITAVRTSPQAVVLEAQQHFFTGGLGMRNPAAPPWWWPQWFCVPLPLPCLPDPASSPAAQP